MLPKPASVQQIEQLWGASFQLHPAPVHNFDPHVGLMAHKTRHPKYLLDDQGRLIGLNLAATGLDDTRWEKILRLLGPDAAHLRALNLNENQLTAFPPHRNLSGLVWLDLSENGIRDFGLPEGNRQLANLRMDENPLENLPSEIVKSGNAAILDYFRQIDEQEGTEPLYEAKLLIIGEPGAGKTTLLKKLDNPDYLPPLKGDKNIKSTVGINILEDWKFPYTENKDIQFKANIWDFGGQEIQYMTHHFFLTPRALYILVADDRKQNTEFDYWFRIINLLGRENDNEKIRVLVVLNEINHQSISNFDLGIYQRDYPGMEIQKQEVDFSHNDERWVRLQRLIKEMLCTLPHIGDPLPRLWQPIRNDLINKRKEKPHINFEEFVGICTKDRNGKRIHDESSQRNLSRYLHRLGVLLHYQEDDALDNFVILRPQWAVDAVYSVLKNDKVEKNQGRFTTEDLKDYWSRYTPDERSRLLSLMLKDKFEICYTAPQNDIYIAPQLLPSLRPDYNWVSMDAMKFRYQYAFMPKGLISRLIVRLSEYIGGNGQLVWKEGVIIQDRDCHAQVIQRKTIKEGLEVLEIELVGAEKEKKYLLRRITTEVEKIHERSFKHIVFERMIPCICEHCNQSDSPTFFEYSELLKYQDQKVPTIRCSKILIKEVSVQGLLEGVFDKEEIRTLSKKEKSTDFDIKPNIIINLPDFYTEVGAKPFPNSSDPLPVKILEPKKPWYKKWWFWLISLIGVFALIAEATGFHVGKLLKLIGFAGWD